MLAFLDVAITLGFVAGVMFVAVRFQAIELNAPMSGLVRPAAASTKVQIPSAPGKRQGVRRTGVGV